MLSEVERSEMELKATRSGALATEYRMWLGLPIWTLLKRKGLDHCEKC